MHILLLEIADPLGCTAWTDGIATIGTTCTDPHHRNTPDERPARHLQAMLEVEETQIRAGTDERSDVSIRTSAEELAGRLEGATGHPARPGGEQGRRLPPRPSQGRLFWMTVGVMAGAGMAHLLDPDRGRERRIRIRDQAVAKGRALARSTTRKARYMAGKAQGATIEAAKTALPEDVPADPRKLEQRIRSDVFGYRDDVHDVVIKVEAPGEVTLSGSVPSRAVRDGLLAEVNDVEGVLDVNSDLSVHAG